MQQRLKEVEQQSGFSNVTGVDVRGEASDKEAAADAIGSSGGEGESADAAPSAWLSATRSPLQ